MLNLILKLNGNLVVSLALVWFSVEVALLWKFHEERCRNDILKWHDLSIDVIFDNMSPSNEET